MVKKAFGFDCLKSILNRDMEVKGIVLPELSCRTATEAPPPELPDCCQSFGSSSATPAGGARSQSGSSGGERDCTPGAELPGCHQASPAGAAGLPPKLPRRSSPAGAAGLPPKLRRTPCQAVTWQTDKLDIYFCMEYRSQHAGPQNLSYALIGGGWERGR